MEGAHTTVHKRSSVGDEDVEKDRTDLSRDTARDNGSSDHLWVGRLESCTSQIQRDAGMFIDFLLLIDLVENDVEGMPLSR